MDGEARLEAIECFVSELADKLVTGKSLEEEAIREILADYSGMAERDRSEIYSHVSRIAGETLKHLAASQQKRLGGLEPPAGPRGVGRH